MALALGSKIVKPLIIGVTILIIVAVAVFAGYQWKAQKCAQAYADAVEKVRAEEQAKQEKINAAAETKYQNLLGINARLHTDLNGLRVRTARISEESRAKCEGSSGAELSREDAEFLTREAARADTIREGLRECYSYADTVTK